MTTLPPTNITRTNMTTTLVELPSWLRRARVDGASVALRGMKALRVEGRGSVVLDVRNAIAEIDGNVTLAHAARVLARKGAVFPLARALPPFTLMQACAALPFFVDAFVQHAVLLTGEGDGAETPRAPRAAAGPSLLGALCSRPPLAVATKARVRVMLAKHARVRREVHASTRAAAERVRVLLDDSRVFSVDAFGSTVLVLDGASSASSSAPSSERFAHAGAGRRARFTDARSLAPGDVDAIFAALDDGARVLAAPFMGRCAKLYRAKWRASNRARDARAEELVDTERATRMLTASWLRDRYEHHDALDEARGQGQGQGQGQGEKDGDTR